MTLATIYMASLISISSTTSSVDKVLACIRTRASIQVPSVDEMLVSAFIVPELGAWRQTHPKSSPTSSLTNPLNSRFNERPCIKEGRV